MPAASSTRSILLVTNDLGPRAGGIETFILGLLNYVDGKDLVIYTSSEVDAAEDLAFDRALGEKHGVVVIRDKAKVLLPTPRVRRNLINAMKKYGSNTVWFGAAAPLAWVAPALRKAGATRIVGLTHGHEVWWSRVFPFTLAMRRIGNGVDVLTYLGNFTRDAMRPAVGEKVELIHIAPGISVDHFTPGAKPNDLLAKYDLVGKRVIISVGRLVHRKGQDRLVEALPLILQAVPETVLVFVGTGPHKKFIEKLAKKLGVTDSIRFIGRVQFDELPRHIRMGEIFAMPSRSRFFGLEVEGLGIVYLEASACGLPVIAGNSGGAPDALIPGETGLVVDGNDINDIAAAAIVLIRNPEKSESMGRAGRQWAEREWNWDLWGKRFAALLNKS